MEEDDVEVIYLDEDEDFAEEVPDEDMFSEEPEDDEDFSKTTFAKHSKSVFCGDLSKNSELAATGGEDDFAYLWSTQTGDVKLTCTGHKDSVIAVCFNHDNKLLATGDMSGLIQVWNVQDSKLIWCYESDDLEWLSWHTFANVLIAGTQSGEVYVWQIPQGNCHVLTSHGSSCTCGKLLPDGKQILAGYADGLVKLWDIKSGTVKWQVADQSKGNVTSIEIDSSGTLCSVAPSSSLINISNGKSLGALLVEGETDIEAHIFSSELNLLVTGSLSGQVCVWDVAKHVIRHQARLDSGITVLKLGSNGTVFIGSTRGPVYLCDVRTGSYLHTLKGHKANVLSLCLALDGGSVLTTSDDKTAKIFLINEIVNKSG
ncbi:angio-associated migratory cell protein [Tribolium castaneum]|uniref:Protein will die slowly-like Protein n=1 Tax=Tribolium castaneum TaxID=7070 RepID=D6WN00_TRICA|nr:PREDICTED: angio-associated migratory cell protein [Tribolium castaneum]EFA03258.1 Protein will die slowly-like Protein [Tribolium castaneum]|eukprot:XP_969848.1 PREDICTED: angio-associated migratory cell protein [Tribolium castaneum]